MKYLQNIGIGLLVTAFLLWLSMLSIGNYQLTNNVLRKSIPDSVDYALLQPSMHNMVNKTYTSKFNFIHDFNHSFNHVNDSLKAAKVWNKVIYTSYVFRVTKNASRGPLAQHPFTFFLIIMLIAVAGALLYILPEYSKGPPGIHNDHVFHHAMTARGWIGIILGALLILFYIVLYWYPEYITNWVLLMDPLSEEMSGGPASQWFLYGFLYTMSILVMGIRMLLKYRHNKYQKIRTYSVMFFQTAFAFILPEILVALNKPYFDFKNIWPLNYSFFYDYNLKELINSGTLGWFMLIWGIALIVIAVPVITYFFGKRWYCSWVCGCGGLAETLGDPYRQLSSKKLKAWKIERWIIHGVLVFAVVMTAVTLINYFSHNALMGGATGTLHKWYGFFIGSLFAGVIGVGFYPLMGNRMWCRFGCPLAAYLGMVQRFKSRFRITTNGGQCISCGNCSTYCEMGIDVKWYAQRGQDIVRSSCVGCGICSAVCPRGVLNLENLQEKGRLTKLPELTGNNNEVD